MFHGSRGVQHIPGGSNFSRGGVQFLWEPIELVIFKGGGGLDPLFSPVDPPKNPYINGNKNTYLMFLY